MPNHDSEMPKHNKELSLFFINEDPKIYPLFIKVLKETKPQCRLIFLSESIRGLEILSETDFFKFMSKLGKLLHDVGYTQAQAIIDNSYEMVNTPKIKSDLMQVVNDLCQKPRVSHLSLFNNNNNIPETNWSKEEIQKGLSLNSLEYFISDIEAISNGLLLTLPHLDFDELKTLGKTICNRLGLKGWEDVEASSYEGVSLFKEEGIIITDYAFRQLERVMEKRIESIKEPLSIHP